MLAAKKLLKSRGDPASTEIRGNVVTAFEERMTVPSHILLKWLLLLYFCLLLEKLLHNIVHVYSFVSSCTRLGPYRY